MTAARRTFTRLQLTAALDAIDRPDLADGMYSRRLDFADGGGTALAFDYDDPADLGLFLVTVATLLGPVDGGDFAGALHIGLPAHPDGGPMGLSGAYWPRWVLDEPTWEEWNDEQNGCVACCGDDDHDADCPTHDVAPWQRRPELVP